MLLFEIIKSKNEVIIALSELVIDYEISYKKLIQISKLLINNRHIFTPAEQNYILLQIIDLTSDIIKKSDRFMSTSFFPDLEIRRLRKNIKNMRENIFRILKKVQSL